MTDRQLTAQNFHDSICPVARAGPAVNRLWAVVLRLLVLPTAIYTACFFVLTYPLSRVWSSEFFCDAGDGLQNEWNLWWVHKAIVELHQSPWFTTWLHAPHGTTLIGHTLNIFNGLIGIPLSLMFSHVQVYNLIVIGCFVFSGVTAFWLARYVTGEYVPALFGGFAFTFTGYHFAHARGHMQLISMEFIPLFLLAWLRMLEQPGFRRAVWAGCCLGLVALCDFYYVLYCVMAGALSGLFYLSHLREVVRGSSQSRRYLQLRFAVFAVVAFICCGPFFVGLVTANARDPFVGAHNASVYSADLFAAFIPGGANLLGRITTGYWSCLTANIADQSVYLGLSVCAMAIYGLVKNRGKNPAIAFWAVLAVGSYVLSLGPILHIDGRELTGRVLPYAWMEQLLPMLQLGGCPGRITVMAALAVSMLMSLGIASIWRSHAGPSGVLILAAIALLMSVDLWPSALPTTPANAPAWTAVLRNLPLRGAVISNVGNDDMNLYCQTLFDRPMAMGYISRIPASVDAGDRRIIAVARSHDFALLREMGFAYLLMPPERLLPGLPVVYADDEINIQQLPDAPKN